jgi:hypothetical protein
VGQIPVPVAGMKTLMGISRSLYRNPCDKTLYRN